MKRMRRPLMQISGDNSRRIDYSEGREIHSGWAQECEEETVANLRWAMVAAEALSCSESSSLT